MLAWVLILSTCACSCSLFELDTCLFCFVCLFVGIKPEKLYSASCVWEEVNPLGVVTHGQRHRPRAYQRQRYRPRTCQSMVCCCSAWTLGRGGFIYTLEIIACILSDEVNRDRLCGTNALISVTSAIFGAVKPLEEVPTQSSLVWSFVECESNSEVLIRPSNYFGCFGPTLRKKAKCKVVLWCGGKEN